MRRKILPYNPGLKALEKKLRNENDYVRSYLVEGVEAKTNDGF